MHAEQCVLSNVFLHSQNLTDERVLILAGSFFFGLECVVTETPCGHCRQILQELPGAGDIRVIVKKVGMDCLLRDLLPYTFALDEFFIRFELPVDGIVHHLFDPHASIPSQTECQALEEYLQTTVRSLPFVKNVSEERWKVALEQAITLYKNSFAWYSGCPAVSLFISSQSIVCGGIIESSAYNPTVNPLQVGIHMKY